MPRVRKWTKPNQKLFFQGECGICKGNGDCHWEGAALLPVEGAKEGQGKGKGKRKDQQGVDFSGGGGEETFHFGKKKEVFFCCSCTIGAVFTCLGWCAFLLCNFL